MSITFRPIDQWPGKMTAQRRRSPFRAPYQDTMKLLARELSRARAVKPIVQLALLPGQFRNDGQPYSGAKTQHPGVIVSFTKDGQPLSFPCDTFVDWIENLRAVALALEALRMVDRYGVTKTGEQYRGWAALPPGSSSAPDSMTVEQAARFVAELSFHKAPQGEAFSVHEILSSADNFRTAYRAAVKSCHPDAGGSTNDWKRLQDAQVVLLIHHKENGNG